MATLTIADLDNGKRDLQTVDEVANSRAAAATTRFGQQTTTLYEAIRRINATGDEILSNLGFRVPVPYASGLNVTDSRFTVTGPDGKVYAPLSAPFTAGAWDPTQWYVLQNDLNDHKLLVFDTLASAQAAAATLPDGQVVNAHDVQASYKVQNAELVYQGPLTDYSAAFAEALINASRVRIDTDYTVRIPTHLPDLQSAFDHIDAPQTSKITILIEAGHALTSGLRLDNGDYSNFTISSEDAVVKLADGFTPVPSPEWPTGVVRESTLVFFNCRGPVLNCLIDGELKSQDINGLSCGFGGDYKVLAGAGVKGTRNNLEARECSIHASGAIWDDAFEFCARFTSGVMFSGRDSSYKRSFRNPALTSDPRSGGVLVSRGSYGTLQDSVFEDHPYSPISVRRSHVNMIGAKLNNWTGYAIAFWDGAIAIVNSETLVDGVQIAANDINLGGFNGIFKSGMCLNSNKNPIEITSNASGTLVRYADGFAQVISPDFTANMATAEGQGFKSPISTWDYSSLVSLGDDRRQISAHLTTTHIAFPVIRALSASRVSHGVAGFVSATGVTYRVVASGYWGNTS